MKKKRKKTELVFMVTSAHYPLSHNVWTPSLAGLAMAMSIAITFFFQPKFLPLVLNHFMWTRNKENFFSFVSEKKPLVVTK